MILSFSDQDFFLKGKSLDNQLLDYFLVHFLFL